MTENMSLTSKELLTRKRPQPKSQQKKHKGRETHESVNLIHNKWTQIKTTKYYFSSITLAKTK